MQQGTFSLFCRKVSSRLPLFSVFLIIRARFARDYESSASALRIVAISPHFVNCFSYPSPKSGESRKEADINYVPSFRLLKQHGLAPSAATSPLLAAVSSASSASMSPSASLEMILALERAKMLQQQQQPPPPQPPQSAAAAALKAFTDRQGKKDCCSPYIVHVPPLPSRSVLPPL